jgi:hypothetical protein
MEESAAAARIFERYERRCGDRRVFAYTAYFPERRECLDRRCDFPSHFVELEAEGIESLIEARNELR